MNFADTILTVDMVIKSGSVPLIIGESGIGKTALVKELCRKQGYYEVTIDGNLLKEGEIGGLPTVEEYSVLINGEVVTRKKTVYAIHTKLRQIDEDLNGNPDGKVLLFIDELNRCEHSVQQELMNLVLNREINGYILPCNVLVMAAMNPSNKYSSFENTDYQVTDMDPAQEDRFVWIEMEADVKTWLKWGMEEGNIHEDVLEFIASFPEYLHTPGSKETVKATPRSWERVSNTYRVYLENKKDIPSRIFYNVIKGNVGPSIAQDFYNYIENNKNPIIKPLDIFSKDELSDELIRRIKEESHSRLYMAAKNALIYLYDSKDRQREIRIFTRFIQYYPPDLKMGIMQEIKSNHSELYNEFIDIEEFINGYFEMHDLIEG